MCILKEAAGDTSATFYATVSGIHEDSADAAVAQALGTSEAARRTGASAMRARHRRWWREFWARGPFLSLGDTLLEAVHYVQAAKFASAQRVALHDLFGAFGPYGNNMYDHKGHHCPGPWCQYVWDMNVQVVPRPSGA